jgi:hypothetical protein
VLCSGLALSAPTLVRLPLRECRPGIPNSWDIFIIRGRGPRGGWNACRRLWAVRTAKPDSTGLCPASALACTGTDQLALGKRGFQAEHSPRSQCKRRHLHGQRLAAMFQAVQTVEPVLEKFYGSLSDEQKERFNRLPPRQA